MAEKFDVKRIRNIGIIAHIDAGKTTTTERILFYTGETHRMGEVDEGTTKTDFDAEEQNRGITIYSAAVSCRWKDIRINIIDTPGHVDFTAEVERSLRVLDGGVVIFSGMEGVEAQSETVWHQADRYHVPRICFINKLDRIGADFYRVYKEITDRLGAKLIPLQIPMGQEKEFSGMIDLITEKALYFEGKEGETVREADIPESFVADAAHWREQMIEALADVDDEIATLFLEGETLTVDRLREAVRNATLHHGRTPVLCGASLQKKGVQPVLDAVMYYLPSPLDVPAPKGIHPVTHKEIECPLTDDAPFAGLLFKIVGDEHDELGFVRIYRGTLRSAIKVLNADKDIKEAITRLYHLQASHRGAIEVAHAGDIVGVVGLKNSVTGDTLCDAKQPIILEPIRFPEPVISQSIEPESSKDKDKLAEKLRLMEKEDPTFRARIDEETGEMLIRGMGELHLEVKANRLREKMRIPIRVGRPRVSYRETIAGTASVEGIFERTTPAGSMYAGVEIELSPIPPHEAREQSFRLVDKVPAATREVVPANFFAVIADALKAECLSGGLSGYPLQGIQATLKAVHYREGESTEEAYRFAVGKAVHAALEKAGCQVLEPIMKVEISTPEEYLGPVVSDMNRRRAEIQGTSVRGPRQIIDARCSLREMFGYSTDLRSLTRGLGTYTMEPADYAPAPPMGDQGY